MQPFAAGPATRAGHRKQRISGLSLALLGVNLLAWCWALLAFHNSPALLGSALITWGVGLRHAVGTDHIAAIDDITGGCWRRCSGSASTLRPSDQCPRLFDAGLGEAAGCTRGTDRPRAGQQLRAALDWSDARLGSERTAPEHQSAPTT